MRMMGYIFLTNVHQEQVKSGKLGSPVSSGDTRWSLINRRRVRFSFAQLQYFYEIIPCRAILLKYLH